MIPAPAVSPRQHWRPPLWLPYVAPMALFVLLTAAEGYASRELYPAVYAAKAALVAAALWGFRAAWRHEIRASVRLLPAALLVGLIVFALWIGIDKAVPYPHLGGARTAFNPAAIDNDFFRVSFLVVRFFGLVLLVPVMEELFWRSFLLRWVSDPDDWATRPVGVFTLGALALVSGGFALAHPEWLVALLAGVAYAYLLQSTKSLWACIVAHGVTNLALGVYVLLTGDWKYW